MDPVTLAVVGGAVVAAAAFLEGCGKKREEIEIEETTTGEMKKIEIWTDKPEPGEPVVSGACVMCTNGISESDKVHVVDSGGEMVEMEGIRELSRKDIRLSGCFSGCRKTTDHLCTVSESDIEDQEWKDFDESRKLGEGKEVLDIEKSYMICLKGFGMIYFKDSGQVVRSAWDTLCKYVNDDTMKKIDPLWNTDMFYEVYGINAYDEMKRLMLMYNITNPISICMFLSTIPVECGHGKSKKEEGNEKDFNKNGYSETTKGAGMIQLTKYVQQEFFEYLLESKDLSEKESEEVEAYKYGFEEKDGILRNYYNNSSKYIMDNYPIESAMWYWAKRNEATSINNFIVNHIDDNLYNTFACSQMMVNGTGFFNDALNRIAECSENCRIVPVEYCTGSEEGKKEHKKYDYCFSLKALGRHLYGPNGWESRESCWINAEAVLSGN